jgi:uroporphyrin-III C-methyltransferase/precorrin-2 dehydrogenase/sirohydrochlorin ferrochelatase
MSELLPLFVNLAGRRVLLVGGGPVALSKLRQLMSADADVRIVAPEIHPEIEASGVAIERRAFRPDDVIDVWFVVAAATPEVNREVAEAAEAHHVLVNAVDDPANASAFLGGVVRRDGVTFAVSTSGDAPGLTALLRQALDALLPEQLGQWVRESRRLRAEWKRDGVPMAARRPLLLDALNRLSSGEDVGRPFQGRREGGPKRPALQERRGIVSLVGAGPGDPALLTRKAVARLRKADLVLYDALVDDRVLRYAGRAQRFFVGKRAGRHALTQREIHSLMIRAARRNRRVVRLKGGDPFVFGRGGEEALALAEAGVPCEVVPGVSSATAAAALAGIPLTCRGVASAMLVLSGHDEDAFARAIDGLKAGGLTLVVLMGGTHRRGLASVLMHHGWAPDTPAALVADASLATESVWRGSLLELSADAAPFETDGSVNVVTLVVGDVAALDVRGRQTGSIPRAQSCQ